MDIELFNVAYRPGLVEPPVLLLCQAFNINGEKFLWLDGINAEDPVMVSISAVRDIRWAGNFKEFISTRPDLAQQVLQESQGTHSPTILARALLYMSNDPNLTAAQAIEICDEQAMDIIEADNGSADQFGVALKQFQMSMSA
jgi:hypothetical protein